MSEFSDKLIAQDAEDLLAIKTKPVVKPEPQIGIELDNNIVDNFAYGEASQVDLTAINKFTEVARNRNMVYNTIDTMCDDPTLAAVLETYAEDTTETNDVGDIVWVESANTEVLRYVTYLLDTMRINKNIYKWVYSLCKYGDLYIRLFRNSEIEDPIFNAKDRKTLNEDVKINVYSPNDNYAHYVEMIQNPAQMFELTRFGKTQGYIQAKAPVESNIRNDGFSNSTYVFNFQKRDVEIYEPTEFVHASLEDNISRQEEQVKIFYDDNDGDKSITYNVKKGQSLFYNIFKIWRELSLLESSILLNRYTKSSITRVVQVEVGDMDKTSTRIQLQKLKNLMEQKTSIKTGESMGEYTNPGPIDNTIYVPTHEGKGAITTSQVGGDVDVKSLADLAYFRNKLFGALRVPKQYFGETEDSAGFNGGESLAIISSRYAKMIKRIQNVVCQAITDIVNLMLIDKDMPSYINKFTIKMLPPTTKEELERRENTASKVQIAQDIMNLVESIETPESRLGILKTLLSTVVTDNDIIDYIDKEITKLEEESSKTGDDTSDDNEIDSIEDNEPLDLNIDTSSNEEPLNIETSTEIETPLEDSEIDLPNPTSLGVDMTTD